MGLEVNGPKISFQIPIFNGINVTETIITQWLVMILIMVLVLWLTSNLSKKPSKKQVIAEMLVKAFNDMVEKNMGKKSLKYAPYIASLFIFILLSSLISLTGIRSGVADVNVTMAFAVATFVLITINKFKYKGFLGYFKSFAEPFALLAPINVISEIATPVSLGFRLFGNMAAGMIISSMVYYGLGSVAAMLNISIPIFSVGIPAILSLYFDLFSGVVQAYVFIMLTMVYVGNEIAE